MRKILVVSLSFLIVWLASGQGEKSLLDYQTDGDQRMLANEYQLAIEDFNKAISLSPNDANLYWRRGICKATLKYYNDAIDDYTKAISIYPGEYYYNDRANIEFLLKQYQQAIKDYNQALKDEEPGNFNALSYYKRGMAKHYTKDNDGACSDFQICYEQDNTYAPAEDALNNYCSGVPTINSPKSNTLVSSSENPEVKKAIDNLIAIGGEKEADGDMKGAEEEYTKAINVDVNNSITWWLRGKCREKSGNHQGAIDDFLKSLNLSPDLKVYKDRAETEYLSGNYGAAIDDYTKAISFHSKQEGYFYYYRGMAEYKNGDQAAGCLDLQMSKKANYPEAAGALNKYCGSNNNDDNVPTLAGAAKQELNRGVYYWLIEDYDSARIEFTFAIQLNQQLTAAWYYRSKIWYSLKQMDNACEDLDMAMGLGEPDALRFIKKYCGGE